MSIVATSGANMADKGSEVHQSPSLSRDAIQYKKINNSPGLLGTITSPVSKHLSSRKVSQLSEKKSIFQKDHGQLRLFTGNGAKLPRLPGVQIFNKKKS
ncbi:MAG: hypothetical protein LBC30_00345 [Puniceicoccales bacterium]|jgi:hypothetical protein|nr:hypothetical protein [Puniceicoccales bacterium]